LRTLRMARQGLFGSSLVKKYWMALTGLFLISFLVVHAAINGMIWFNDGGITFNYWAHFMGTNLIIRTMEIVLFLGLIAHVVDGLMLYFQNRAARPVKYVVEKGAANRTWYSSSMALLGTLILLFLIIHLAHFWVKTRHIIGSAEQYGTDAEGKENLFAMMVDVFQSPLVVVIYVLGCFSLFWHLLHGFKSVFQSLGLNHKRYNGLITASGTAFSIIVPTVFALMPISIHLGWIK
ncbi:MAG TPA: succinate dehydrogenase cytochrome b subunit, partial [Flavobacteriales bacterium]|nr:succinate dehydrogenase cytochrome b subunit [Flavobacteriales bacterium]